MDSAKNMHADMCPNLCPVEKQTPELEPAESISKLLKPELVEAGSDIGETPHAWK